MTKPLITTPCTAQELENALHAACDHDGLWDAKIFFCICDRNYPPSSPWYREHLEIQIETKGKQQWT